MVLRTVCHFFTCIYCKFRFHAADSDRDFVSENGVDFAIQPMVEAKYDWEKFCLIQRRSDYRKSLFPSTPRPLREDGDAGRSPRSGSGRP